MTGAETANREVMIRLRDVVKEYRLGRIGYGTLARDLESYWAKLRRRPDPNAKIGQESHLEGDVLRALNGVSLEILKGECVGIIGGNGAGKSTMLKLISRVAVPTKGSIELFGRVTSMLEVGTGFNGEMTGRENIYLNGAILGMTRREIDAKIEEIIDFSGIREFIDTPVKRYSSGMYVKLGFSVAAHLDSEIVIMDEVLAVGDAAFQEKCIRKMRSAAEDESRTVLYVSHNMATVRALCDRCVVLAEGRVIYDGETEEAIRRYNAYLLDSTDAGADLLAVRRRDRNLSGFCRIAGLTVAAETVRAEECLEFTVTFRSERPLDHLYLRMILMSGQGQMTGTAFSGVFRLPEGDASRSFRFPAKLLGPGGYAADLAVVSYDGSVQTRHDFLSRVLRFRVEDREMYFGQQWRERNWGSVKLPEIRVTEAEESGESEEGGGPREDSGGPREDI